MTKEHQRSKLDWVTFAKAIAILGIILNHFVEALGSYNWFTNPSDNWPDLQARLSNLLPEGTYLIERIVYLFGWLGDNFVGVFILLSGLLLTYSSSKKEAFSTLEFIKKRLLRIFPLYIAIHILIVLISLFIPGRTLDIGSTDMLFSLAGLRFTETLFYFVNPSWWFIVLILQLYFVFPFLFKLQKGTSTITFLSIAIGFTLISRLIGILGIYPYGNMYMWMNGSFFGTRLAEFAIGMVIGQFIAQNKQFPSHTNILIWSSLLYISGFISSVFLATTLFSNFFIATGLSGLFYIIYTTIVSRTKALNSLFLWVGMYAFSIYLTHHMGFIWGRAFGGNFQAMLITPFLTAALIALGIFLESGLLRRRFPQISIKNPLSGIIFFAYGGILILLFYFIEPRLTTPYNLAAFNGFLVLNLLVLYYLLKTSDFHFKVVNYLSITLFGGIFLSLFFIDGGYGKATALYIVISLVIIFLLHYVKLFYVKAGIAVAITISFLMVTESYLKKHTPQESGSWGELPALQVHQTRTYSLIPDKVTHLKYNNYDYTLRTNSLGLACPEELILRSKDTSYQNILVLGDAFTMPEGLEYEYSYSALLQNKFDSEGKKYNVINAGVTGYGPNEQLVQLRELLPLFNPKIVLLQFFANEFVDININSEEKLKEIGLFDNKHPQKPLQFPQLNSRISAFSNTLKKAVKSDYIPAYNYYKSFMFLYEPEDNSFYADTTITKIQNTLAEMDSLVKAANGVFLILYTPAQVEVSKAEDISFFPFNSDELPQEYILNKPYEYLNEICKKNNISLINLQPELMAYMYQPVYFRDSWHWNENGHIVVGDVLFNIFINNGL